MVAGTSPLIQLIASLRKGLLPKLAPGAASSGMRISPPLSFLTSARLTSTQLCSQVALAEMDEKGSSICLRPLTPGKKKSSSDSLLDLLKPTRENIWKQKKTALEGMQAPQNHVSTVPVPWSTPAKGNLIISWTYRRNPKESLENPCKSCNLPVLPLGKHCRFCKVHNSLPEWPKKQVSKPGACR